MKPFYTCKCLHCSYTIMQASLKLAGQCISGYLLLALHTCRQTLDITKKIFFFFFGLQFYFVGAFCLGCHVSYTPRYWISVFACDTNLLCFSIVVIRQLCLVGQGFSTVIVLTSRFPWQNWKCIIYRLQFILSLIRSLNFVFGRTLCTSYLCFVIPIFSYNINWQAADIAYT